MQKASRAAGLAEVAAGPPQAEFQRRKEQILASLDRSPKGSIDAPIVDFLNWLNAQPAVVTTSSCSGRISVFLGAADPSSSKGGEWLLISHEHLDDAKDAWERVSKAVQDKGAETLQGSLVSFLLEPFVLHAECADSSTAQRLLELAREVGFRESGISLGKRRVMLQLRTLALRMEVPLAVDGTFLAGQSHFEALVRLANERLAENGRRVQKLWALLQKSFDLEVEEEQEGTPWVLACPQTLAKAVKLALEERGWLDEARRMAPLPATEGQEARIGLPVTEAAAAALWEEPPAEPDVAAGAAAGSSELQPEKQQCSPVQQQTTDADAGKEAEAAGTKPKKRPAPVAADLYSLWSKSRVQEWPLALQRSDALPHKEKPVQRGTPTSCSEQEALKKAALQVSASVRAAGGPDLSAGLVADLEDMGALQWRGDVALLPRGKLCGGDWERLAGAAAGGLWEPLRSAVGARLLARQQEIRVDDEVRGGAVEVLAGQGDGWVVVPGPKGVRYTFDVTRCMFSEGNATEKVRVSQWAVRGQTILDLYAGIGFWTLPLLAAGAEQIFACEWNTDALEALRRGLDLLGDDAVARCQVLAGDNRRQEVREQTEGRCDRVMLGLIPTSRDGFPAAVAALRSTGGMLHVHWNVPGHTEEETSREVMAELQSVLRKERGDHWQCSLTGIQRIKWFAPRVRHVRIDVRCQPGS